MHFAIAFLPVAVATHTRSIALYSSGKTAANSKVNYVRSEKKKAKGYRPRERENEKEEQLV